MPDRFYPNEMPEFIKEEEPPPPETTTNPLTKTLSLPYNLFSDQLKRAAFDLKRTIVSETWGNTGKRLTDYTLYTGALGTASIVFKAYTTRKILIYVEIFLKLAILPLLALVFCSRSPVTFICGQVGVSALGVVVAKQSNDDQLFNHYLTRFKKIKLPKDLPNELFFGRTGYLWACLFINKNLGENIISYTHMREIKDEIIKAGRNMSTSECPLMYEWYGKRYWGAAHGLAGIMNVLMDMELTEDELKDVKSTLIYMINNRFPNGNYRSSEGSNSDHFIDWCLGATGMALTLTKAATVFGSDEFLKAATDAGEVVWKRGLLKKVGICHGISGNAYVFLSLYRLTGDIKFLYRAKAFATFLYHKSQTLITQGSMHGGDRPFSLF
ncbi:unnamed protein product [Lactuca saligna]|uniref:Uncharacterized protein n=1 Tax=Lactuca saligna TaxID=75948 RepID=A0AA35Z0V9_LACSI|nr:unnamed protein product [Lactuca saligna]